MIQANELRIGNYVIYNNIVTKVYSIQSPTPTFNSRFNNKFIIDLFEGAGIVTATIEEVKPIPLTEQWLIDFGFVSNPYNDEYFLPNKLILDINKMKGRLEIHWKHVELKHVHQLQNLYFALTGIELNKQ